MVKHGLNMCRRPLLISVVRKKNHFYVRHDNGIHSADNFMSCPLSFRSRGQYAKVSRYVFVGYAVRLLQCFHCRPWRKRPSLQR